MALPAPLPRHRLAPAGQQERPWTTGQLLALAWRRCPECGGEGRAGAVACDCVWDAVFRQVYRRYRDCQQFDPRGWHRKNEEFMADFEAVARRATGELWPLFQRHFCQGRPIQQPVIERKMILAAGRAFRNTQPYPLFPVGDYFAGGN